MPWLVKQASILRHDKPCSGWLDLVGDPGFASHEQQNTFEECSCVACPDGPVRGLLPSMIETVTGTGFLARASPCMASQPLVDI